MKFIALRPIIRTLQFTDTIQFYTRVLGFEISNQNDDLGWAFLEKDTVGLMVATPNRHDTFDQPTFTGSFCFNTDNVDELWERLKGKAKICYPIEDFEWEMREFAVYDNNNYILQFGQNIAE